MPNEPKKPDVRARNRLKNCASCGADLGGLNYFCRDCYFLAPGNERAALYAMHDRKQDVTTKVEKICRLIAKRRAKKKEAT